MICEVCKNNEANVHLTKIVNGIKEEKNLCEKCAREIQGFNITSKLEKDSPFSFQNMLSGIIDYMNQTNHSKESVELQCKQCGTRYSEFKKGGLLGCSECYENFNPGLLPVIKRVQGNTNHVGKIPVKSGKDISVKKELLKLKEELQKAIALEEYELAIELRDKIRDIQSRIGGE